MTLEITNIRDSGIAKSERLVMKATTNLDVGEYAVFATGYRDGTPLAQDSLAYWFPDKKVAKGDLVVLYTRAGVLSEKVNASGSTSHFFYWDHADALWKSGETAAVVAKIAGWSFKTP
jgi:hypothetical protein